MNPGEDVAKTLYSEFTEEAARPKLVPRAGRRLRSSLVQSPCVVHTNRMHVPAGESQAAARGCSGGLDLRTAARSLTLRARGRWPTVLAGASNRDH